MKISWRTFAWLAVVLCVLMSGMSWIAPASTAAQSDRTILQADDPTATATTESEQPAETEPPAPTDEPVATEEPIATDIPPTATQPTVTEEPAATEITAPTVPTEVESTATATEPEESEFSSADTVPYFTITLQVCGNDARDGQLEFLFSGDITAADTSIQCRAVGDAFPGSTVTVTLQNEAFGPYVASFSFSGRQFEFFDEIEEGTYGVTVATQPGGTANINGSLNGTITLDAAAGGFFGQRLDVYYYTEEVPTLPTTPGSGGVYGQVTNCLDPGRAGETDFFIDGFVAADAEQCQQISSPGQTGLTLTGMPVEGGTYGPVTIEVGFGGSFYLDDVPYGTYTLTELATGNPSLPFQIGITTSAFPQIQVVNYFEAAPEPFPVIQVQKLVCGNAERAGEVDYVVVTLTGFGVAETCLVQPSAEEFTITLRSTDGTFEQSLTVPASFQVANYFTAVPPGTYTVQEDGQPPSEPFTVAPNDQIALEVINYVEPTTDQPPPTGEGSVLFFGNLAYCSSVERDGEVDFIIDSQQPPQPTGGAISAAATGECDYGGPTPGIITLTRYADAAGTQPIDSQETDNQFGSFFFGELPPGYYRLGFQPTAFADPVMSDVFPLYESSFTIAIILVYQGEQAAPVYVMKEFCFDPLRDGETDFHVESEGFNFGAVETTTCRLYEEGDEPIEFTLTNTDTGDAVTISAGPFSSNTSLPPGTYTLTEASASLSATSDQFTIELNDSGYTIFVRNYNSEPIVNPNPQEQVSLVLSSFNCVDDARDGEFDYFFTPGQDIVTTGDSAFNAAANQTEECAPSGPGEYAFELIGGPEVVDQFAAAATYPLSPVPGDPNVYFVDNAGESTVPAGGYVIRETTTGFTSDPLVIDARFNEARFYVYAAAPTPTPTATATPTGTPDPSATATATPVDPGATATPTEPGGFVIPGGDDDDPGDDGDGGDDSEDGGNGDGTGGGDGTGAGDGSVSQLPSTGQAQAGSSTGGSLLLGTLSATALLLLIAAFRSSRQARR